MKPVSFRLYPEHRRGLYVLVQVWPNRTAMLKHGKSEHRNLGRSCHGSCTDLEIIDFKRNHLPRKKPIFAEVNLYRGRLTMEVVTHEFFHATIAWGRRIGFDWQRLGADDSVNETEERMTYVHGQLCRDFVQRAIDRGLYQ